MRTTDASPAVLAEDVGKTFLDHGRRTQALAGLDLEVSSGEFVSIIGPSGCGKSTLLRLIGGLIDPDRGRLTVDGQPPTEGRAAKRFGLVPQSPALLPWRTVRENLTLLPNLNRGQGRGPVTDDEIDDLLQAVGLAPFAGSLPAELSGGMQQRVSLVRAFALRPPVLLMDEPFAALDEITRSDMRFLLLDLWRDTKATVVFVTHSIEEAVLLSDRVLVFTGRPGQVADDLVIELDRPRRHGVEDDDDFHHHAARLRASLNRAAETATAIRAAGAATENPAAGAATENPAAGAATENPAGETATGIRAANEPTETPTAGAASETPAADEASETRATEAPSR